VDALGEVLQRLVEVFDGEHGGGQRRQAARLDLAPHLQHDGPRLCRPTPAGDREEATKAGRKRLCVMHSKTKLGACVRMPLKYAIGICRNAREYAETKCKAPGAMWRFSVNKNLSSGGGKILN
jgi:hypothetical protein